MPQHSLSLRPEALLSLGVRKTLPLILQTEAAECGLACIAMIASFYGRHTDLVRLRQQYSISTQGANLKQIMHIAANMGLSTRALRLELEHLEQLQPPCILHWEMQHFVVLKKVTSNKLFIHDPAIGERQLSLLEVDKLFTGIALELNPGNDFTPGQDRHTLKLRHFWSSIRGLKSSLLLILALSLLLQLFAIISPYFMQLVVDDVLLRSDNHLLLVLALGFGLLLLIETGTGVLRQLVTLGLSTKLNMQMSANVFHRLIRLPMDYFGKRHMGDVISRFGSTQAIRELLTNGMVAIVIDGLMALIVLLVMFLYDSRLSLIVLAILCLYALLRYLLYRPLRQLNEESIVSAAKENSHLMETIRAMQTIKLFGKEVERQNQWQNRLADAINKDIRIAHWDIGFRTANQLLFGAENILVIYFAATAVMQDHMSVGMLYAFISYKNRFIAAMDGLIGKWIEFRMLELHFDRLADIVFTPAEAPQLHSQEPANQAPCIKGQLEAQNLYYRYSSVDTPILQHINISIEAGTTVAIIGPSGCGKSTLLKCFMGLLQPTSGQILIDQTPLTKQPSYRQQIAAVMQEDQLLSGSIADNIACFDNPPDRQRIQMAAQMACIHQDIVAMNMQYNTLVGDMGTNLSGGQKQRLILARALYRQPAILFMDEATSHLDSANEAQINHNISQLPMTRIIIAHRHNTICSAQRILALGNNGLVDITHSYKAANSQQAGATT